MSSAFKVAVLLCTYNGQAYLEQQLETIAEQAFTNIDLYVSDDGSTDATLTILETFKLSWTKGCFEIFAGPQKGFAENFMSLILNPAIQADFYAYSDQDDCWFVEKISHAVRCIEHQQDAALYCSRTQLVDEQEHPLGFSPLFRKPPSFNNALVQSMGGGNTMLFNQAARKVLLQAKISAVPSHDWWTYILISGCGGFIHYDPVAWMAYRQHAHNIVGSNQGYKALLIRCVMVLNGRYRAWSVHNSVLLEKVKPLLSDTAQHTLVYFKMMRSPSLFKRVYGLFKAGVYRQSLLGNVFLFVAVIIGKA